MLDPHWVPRELTPDDVGATPEVDGLLELLRDTAEVDRMLTEHKALVLRGFGVGAAEVEEVMDLAVPGRSAYVHGNSPRTKVGDNVYTSTEYPDELTISMHNELSYSHRWPSRLLFFCAVAAEEGGATPVVDGERWLDALGEEIRDAFADGVRYVQNLHGGMGLGRSWQDTFETDDRDDVDAFLAESGAEWEWRRDGSLRVSQLRPATIRHPGTGERVWFNQSDQWHPAGLGDDVAKEMAKVLPRDQFPQWVCFADGTPIPDEYIARIRDSGLDCAVDVDWRSGDLMLIDNVLVGHGRRPFRGARRVLVAMS